MKTPIQILALVALTGCSSFDVVQTDRSIERRLPDKSVVIERDITSKIRARAQASSSQNLSKLKALQTDKTQSFGVDSSQQQGATNVVETINAATKFIEAAGKASLAR